MPHLWAGGVGTLGDEAESNCGTAVRTFGADGFFIHEFVVFFPEPHQLKALRTASDLRSHCLPLTLRLATNPDRKG